MRNEEDPVPSFSLPFEQPIVELEQKLRELRQFSEEQDIDVSGEVRRIEEKIRDLRRKIYSELTPWQQVQVARHPQRPYTRDFIAAAMTDFVELHGDRLHADDLAIVGGFASLGGRRIMVIGTQKGRDTKSNVQCHFGCAYPEGYRKARRLMRLAARFGCPIVTLIDTPGAYPGIESEERHIAEAIAVNLREMFTLRTPIVVCVIGEGGSGGALGIGVGDRILMLEHAYYSVISPEGCAAILWKDRAYADRAAAVLRLTARDLLGFGLIDEIVPEPEGGAHTDSAAAAAMLSAAVGRTLDELVAVPLDELIEARYRKFRRMGVVVEAPMEPLTPPEGALPPEAAAAAPPEAAATPPAESLSPPPG